jgi:hypothetical protein
VTSRGTGEGRLPDDLNAQLRSDRRVCEDIDLFLYGASDLFLRR